MTSSNPELGPWLRVRNGFLVYEEERTWFFYPGNEVVLGEPVALEVERSTPIHVWKT